MSSGTVRVVGFLVSLAAFVLVRSLTRGLPWWLSVLLAIAAMLVAGRLAGVAAVDLDARLRRRRADALRRGVR
jgi:ribose/xylose/arabinose/galactoside ABC-type transport system permease subunit